MHDLPITQSQDLEALLPDTVRSIQWTEPMILFSPTSVNSMHLDPSLAPPPPDVPPPIRGREADERESPVLGSNQ
jgi:hypothetical protein